MRLSSALWRFLAAFAAEAYRREAEIANFNNEEDF
jgi:hypothetical protein